MNQQSLLAYLVLDALWAGIAALGFAVLFSVPRRWLWVCVVLGALGHATRALLLRLSLVGLEGGTLIGAVLVGVISLLVARHDKVPVTTFGLPAAIPMVPGAYAFKAMLGLLRLVTAEKTPPAALAVEALVSAAKTALILTAIVVGVGFPSLISRKTDLAEFDS